MHVNKRYFDALMQDKGLSLRSLAKLMELRHSQLSLTFSGTRRMQMQEAVKLADIFNVPLSQVVQNAGIHGVTNAGRSLPITGLLRGDGTVDIHGKDVSETAIAPDGLPTRCSAIQARTADTPLAWMDGWVMFYEPRKTLDADIIGRFCFARIRNGPAVMATIRRGYQDGAYALSGPCTSENAILEWASPIIIARL